uniref:BPL/LPL catalytic domain-containing protein n=1 Tax=Strongyloides papillosus TaxID=174720 RepID=A0A0N5B439_STREA
MLFFAWSLVLSAINYARKQRIISILSRHFLSPLAYQKTIICIRHKKFGVKESNCKLSTDFTDYSENISQIGNSIRDNDMVINNFIETTNNNDTSSTEMIELSPEKDDENLTNLSQSSSIQTFKKTSPKNSILGKAQSEQMLHRWDDNENILFSKDNLEIIAQVEPYKLFENEWDIIDVNDGNLINILKKSISNAIPTTTFIAHLHPISYSNMDLLKKVFGDVAEATIKTKIKETMKNALPPLDLDSEIIFNLAPLLLESFCKKVAVRKTNPYDVIFKCNLDTFYNIVYYWSESALYSATDLSFVDSITCISPSYIEILTDINENNPILLPQTLLTHGKNLSSSLSSSLVSINNSISSIPLTNNNLPLLELLYLLDQQSSTNGFEKTSTLPSKFKRRHHNSECLSNKHSFFSDSGLHITSYNIKNYNIEDDENFYGKTSSINLESTLTTTPRCSLRSLRASSNPNRNKNCQYRPPLPSSMVNCSQNTQSSNIQISDPTDNNEIKYKLPHHLLWEHTSRFPGCSSNFYSLTSNIQKFSNNQKRSLRSISATGHLEKDYLSSESSTMTANHRLYPDKINSNNLIIEKEPVHKNILTTYPYQFRNRSFSESENNNNKKVSNISIDMEGKLTSSLEQERLIGNFSTKYPFSKIDTSNLIINGRSISTNHQTLSENYKKSLIQIRNRKSHSCLPDNRKIISIKDIKDNKDILIYDNNKILKKYYENMFAECHLNQLERFKDNKKKDVLLKMPVTLNLPANIECKHNKVNNCAVSLDFLMTNEKANERQNSMCPKLLGSEGSSITNFIANQITPSNKKASLRRCSYTPTKNTFDTLTPPQSSRGGESYTKTVIRMDRSNNSLCYPTITSNNIINSKPPKILIFTGKDYKLFFKVQETLEKLIAVDYYTIHQLSFEKLKTDLWMEPSTALLIICDTYSLDCESWAKLQIYFSNNGRVIFLCQNSILDNFKCTKKWTCKDNWIKKLFNGRKSGKNISKDFNNFLKKCHKHFKHNEDINEKFNSFDSSSGTNYSVHFKKEKNTPLLLLLESSANNAVALFSDASTEEIITSKYLDDVKKLIKKTGVKMNSIKEMSNDMKILTIGNLVVMDNKEASILNDIKFLEDIGNNPIISFYPQNYNYSKIRNTNKYFQSIQYVPKGIILRDFDTREYFGHLKTKTLGHAMIHIDTCESVMKISSSLTNAITTYDGTIVIANTQKYGRINEGNTWISPKGCAIFSFDFNVPIQSNLGSKISFLQHILAVSIVDSIKYLTKIPDLPIQIKWPNGIYYDKKVKIGSVKMAFTVYGNIYKCVIGGNINIGNSKPTLCINDLLPKSNDPKLSVAVVIAEILNNFERYSKMFERTGYEPFLIKYTNCWMHDKEDIYVDVEDLQLYNAPCIVCGLDKDGFLIAKEKSTRRLIKIYDTGKLYDNLKGRAKTTFL